MEDGFRIGAGLEDVAFFQQVLPQALEVVDLPVEDKHLGAVLVENGLTPAFQIDDGKPPEPQGNLVIHIVVGVVRPPVNDPVGHCLDYILGACHLRGVFKSHKTAHGAILLFRL